MATIATTKVIPAPPTCFNVRASGLVKEKDFERPYVAIGRDICFENSTPNGLTVRVVLPKAS